MELGHTIKCLTTGMPVLLTGGKPGCRAGDERLAYSKLDAPENITVSSEAFHEGEALAQTYSQDGMNISPPLRWDSVPAGTESVVLMVEDPDAPTPMPFVHWLAYNIGPAHRSMSEGISPAGKRRPMAPFLEGKNSTLHMGYVGAAPPKGDSEHRYHFQVFALDRVLELPAGAGRSALMKEMEGHVLGKGRVIGTYKH